MRRDPASEAPDDVLEETARFQRGMVTRLGLLPRLLMMGRFLRRVRLPEHSVERVRRAEARGPVVYVLLRPSAIDYLALAMALARNELPLAEWSNGLSTLWWRPVVEAWRAIRANGLRPAGSAPASVEWLGGAIASGVTVALFLSGTGGWRRFLRGYRSPDPLEAVFRAQERCESPLQLVPAVVVWDRSPDVGRSAADWFLLGNREEPWVLTRVRNLYLRSRGAFVQIGEPIDLSEVRSRFPESERPEALRTLIRRYLKRESLLVRGPRLLPRRVMRKLVLDAPPMRELALTEARATGRSPEQVRRQMEREYAAIAANFKWWVVSLLDVLLRPLWTRVFAGVHARDEDLERIRAAMRQGTAILMPSHKSHFDYLLLSWAFYEHDLIIPHVVAGMNLAVWPVSFFLRRVGGFFVKRTFAGERLHPAIFSRYLRELILQGYPVEFYLEGGRTRTGKLLRPRVGVLGIVLDVAQVRPRGHEVTLLPISLAYEQVAEEGVYARELAGGAKKAESLGQVLKARSVLRYRFGKAYLRVGEPVAVSELVDTRPDQPSWAERSREDRREVLQRVGERVIHRIGKVVILLPSSLVATALLAHHRRAIRHGELVARIERFHRLFLHAGAHGAASLERPEEAITRTLARFDQRDLLDALELDGERVWSIQVKKRISLNFYKNQVLHYLATAGLAALALRTAPDTPRVEDLRDPFGFLVWILRHEFTLDPDRSLLDLLDEGLSHLEVHGAIERVGGRVMVVAPERVGEIHALFAGLVEVYAAVLRHRSGPLTKREMVRVLQGRTADLLRGEVSRPEALSKVTLANAVGILRDEGALAEDDEGRLTPVPARAEALERRLMATVR